MQLPCRRFGRTNLEMPVLSLGGMRFQKSWDEMKFSEISLNDQNKVENILNLANKFGFQLPRWLQIEFSRVVQKKTEDSGGEINPDQIWDLFNKYYLESEKVISLENFKLEKQEGREFFTAQIDYFGKEIPISGQGDGILDALVEALKGSINIDLEIMEYGEHALGQGADAEAVTYIQIRYEDKRYSGVAISKDIVTSSINAFMGAASQLLSEQQLAA